MSTNTNILVLGPFENLADAQTAVRDAKASSPGQPITVMIAEGEYFVDQTLRFGPDDSGTPDAPVTFKAEGAVRLTGALAPKACVPLKEADIPDDVKRAVPEPSRSRVVVLDIPRINPDVSIKPVPISLATGDGTVGFTSDILVPPEVIADDEPAHMARHPGIGGEDWLISGQPLKLQDDVFGQPIGQPHSPFNLKDDPTGWPSWKRWGDIWGDGYLYTDWAHTFYEIEGHDGEEGWIHCAGMSHYGPRPGQRFRFINVLEALREPGTYTIDTELEKIFFLLPDSGMPGRLLVTTQDKPLILCQDASHITFDGFILEDGRGNGIWINGGEGIEVTQCEIRHFGHRGVIIHDGQGHCVTQCHIHGVGGAAVVMTGGDFDTLTPSRHTTSDCNIHHYGRITPCYEGGVCLHGVGGRVLNNHIHHSPHTVIFFYGNDHIIEGNEIHHYTLETGDAGAIYSWLNPEWRGTIIRRNHIHHSGTSGRGGSMGVYLDNCLSGNIVEENFFEHVTSAIVINGGRDNDIRRNVFKDCTPAIAISGLGMDTTPPWSNGMIGIRDLFLKLYDKPDVYALYKERYRGLEALEAYFKPGQTIDPDDPVRLPPEGNIIEGNINTGGLFLDIWTTWYASPDHLTVRDNLDCALNHDVVYPQGQEKPQDQYVDDDDADA